MFSRLQKSFRLFQTNQIPVGNETGPCIVPEELGEIGDAVSAEICSVLQRDVLCERFMKPGCEFLHFPDLMKTHRFALTLLEMTPQVVEKLQQSAFHKKHQAFLLLSSPIGHES